VRWTAAIAIACAACGSAPFPSATQATDARNHDPWIETASPCETREAREEPELHVEEVRPGEGRQVERGDTVRVHYTASVGGQTVHDSRNDGAPLEMIVGSTKTICGFERGILGMHAGGERRVFVPARLAFGEAGKPPDVPANADVVLVVDLFLPADPASGRGVGGPVNPVRGGGGGGRRR
jgi:FKBP-type peptidyl-prolyl cis-trans isomerase